jgi:RHS repeat-associated protein
LPTIPNLLMDSANAYIYGAYGIPAEQVNLDTGTVTFLVADSLGSVRGTVNSSGTLTSTTSYDAWGFPLSADGLTGATPFGYGGGYTDPDGPIYLINRYYDPGTGQFLSVDPDLSETQQPYSYASGDPVNDTDPSGSNCLNRREECGSGEGGGVPPGGETGGDTTGGGDASGGSGGDAGDAAAALEEEAEEPLYASSPVQAQQLAMELAVKEVFTQVFEPNGELRPGVVAGSLRIINAADLENKGLRAALRSAGGEFENWGKYTTQTF